MTKFVQNYVLKFRKIKRISWETFVKPNKISRQGCFAFNFAILSKIFVLDFAGEQS